MGKPFLGVFFSVVFQFCEEHESPLCKVVDQ